ncbi:MAG: hypothetical protein P4L85_00285 [Paludisphaera borealis]|uniref:hypothetical protein n=1 Tax=Paludisphaera borealis TaxID=1387353 RepID=UPI0028478669|nr:hypothetical protein [Paludisphaera borealis]MDR3617762.1 hypothetical protein [Paludisphaera borealis]
MIIMNCPACGAEGRVPNDKINTTMVCKKCLKTFHIKPSGRAAIGEAPITGATSLRHEVDPHSIDHSQDVDQWFEKLNTSFHKLARVAAVFAVFLLIYGVYRWFQPASLEEQAVKTATAIARNDLTAIREMALKGTSDQAVEWFDAVHPEFKDQVRMSASVVPKTEILSTKRDPAHGTAEILTRISLAEPVGRMGVSMPSTSIGSLAGMSIEVPFVLSDRGWSGWQLDGKRTFEAFRKEGEKEAANVGRP